MKKYADRQENLLKQKNQSLKDVLKDRFLKSLVYEKALKDKIL